MKTATQAAEDYDRAVAPARADYERAIRKRRTSMIRVLFAGILGLATLCVVGLGLNYFGYASFAFFNPRFEQVRRTTFEQSQAYVEGQRRDIQNLRIDWLGATGDQKAAIRSVALQRIAGLPESAMSPDVVNFRNELMGDSR